MKKKVSVAKVCMLAGKIMLESGAETYRVEDTMNRIAAVYGSETAQSYATPTAINFSTGIEKQAWFMRIENRSTDLHKIAEVNRISRLITEKEPDISEALTMLTEIEHAKLAFSKWVQIVSAILVSGCFTIMFGGLWDDFIPAAITGGVGFAFMLVVLHFINIRFIADFFASFVIGIFAVLFIKTGYGVELDKIIIGAVMPLVPGLPITNAVRDLLAGHLVAGVSKGVEALLTAIAIGAGVAIIFAFVSL